MTDEQKQKSLAASKRYRDSHRDQIRKAARNYSKKYYQENKEKIKECVSSYIETNKEVLRDKRVAKYLADVEGHRAKWRDYNNRRYITHKDEILKRVSIGNKKWRQNNPYKMAEYGYKRRAGLIRSMPLWYEEDLIKKLYDKRDELNELYGLELTVDHIIPINPRCKTVCGLHCWANLQLLDKNVNSSKNDEYQTDW